MKLYDWPGFVTESPIGPHKYIQERAGPEARRESAGLAWQGPESQRENSSQVHTGDSWQQQHEVVSRGGFQMAPTGP